MFVRDVRRKLAGKKAQNVGKHFEMLFEIACKNSGTQCVAIPDGCETRGFNHQTKRPNIVRVKTPFDYIVTHGKRLAFVDTKTVDGNTFSHSMLTDHQLSALNQLSISANAGLVIWFRSLDQVHFYSVDRIMGLCAGDSVGPLKCPGIALGSSVNFDVRLLFA